MKLQFDQWQKDFLACKGDKQLCTGRQVGKTEVCAEDCRLFVESTEKRGIILMTAPQEFQAEILFSKTLTAFMERSPNLLMTGKDRPTKTEIKIKFKKSRIKNEKPDITIICKTASQTGIGLRGLTVIRKYIDECAQMNDLCWEAIDPQDTMTGGDTIYLSTPFGMQGRFYDCWINKNHAYDSFTRFSISTEECVRNRKICETWTEQQRTKALEKIEQARARLTHRQFMQEYMGEFIESLMQFFPDELIRNCQKENKRPGFQEGRKYYLGVDVGGRGGSESTFEIVMKEKNGHLVHVENIFVNYEMITMTEREIIHLDNIYRFRKIYIDDGGIGAGVYDHLLENPRIKNRIEAINNSKRNLIPLDEKAPNTNVSVRTTLMKNDLYDNLLCMMERGEIDLLDDPSVFQSLKSVQFEITEKKDLIIFSNYGHIAEGIIRGVWGASKDKTLNLW